MFFNYHEKLHNLKFFVIKFNNMFTIDKKNQGVTNNTHNIDKNLENMANPAYNKNFLSKNPKANILITYAYCPEYFLYESHTLKLINNNSLNLNDLIEDMSNTYSTNLNNTAISVFDNDLKSYIYCGIYPFVNEVTIPYELEEKEDGYSYPTIQIKSRQIIKKDNMMRMELNEENPELTDENNQNVFINNKSKRSKERKIGYIIEKVFLWRKLYNGFIDDNGELRKLTLEEAAEKVGISKKSLDDYLIQLR
jgi:Zn-finger protein